MDPSCECAALWGVSLAGPGSYDPPLTATAPLLAFHAPPSPPSRPPDSPSPPGVPSSAFCFPPPPPAPQHTRHLTRCRPAPVSAVPVIMASWEAPTDKPAYTCVSRAVARAVRDVHQKIGRFSDRDLCNVPVDSWRASELDVFYAGQVNGSLLQTDAAAYGTVVAPSAVHGRGVFATRELEAGHRILPFFGQVVYHNLERAALTSRTEERPRLYGGDSVPTSLRCNAWTWLSTSVEVRMHRRFWRGTTDCSRVSWVPSIGTKACVSTARPSARSVWVTPAACCAAGFVNDPRPYDTANVMFEQPFDPVNTTTQLLAPGVVKLLVLRRIDAGEELLVDYGDFYSTFGF